MSSSPFYNEVLMDPIFFGSCAGNHGSGEIMPCPWDATSRTPQQLQALTFFLLSLPPSPPILPVAFSPALFTRTITITGERRKQILYTPYSNSAYPCTFLNTLFPLAAIRWYLLCLFLDDSALTLPRMFSILTFHISICVQSCTILSLYCFQVGCK